MTDVEKDGLGKALAVAGLAGGVAYGVLRVAYFQFYSPLGLTPEDVGLGKAEMVSQALADLVAFGLILVVFGCLLFAGGYLLSKLFRRLMRHPLEPPPSPQPLTTLVRPFVVFVAVIMCVSAPIVLFMRASDDASDLIDRADGVNVASVNLLGVEIPALEVVAVPVELHWIDGSATYPANSACLFLLGQADGTLVLYDVQAGITSRVPSAAVTYTTDPSNTKNEKPECIR